MSDTLRKYEGLINSMNLQELLSPYMDKPLSWIARTKQNLYETYNKYLEQRHVPVLTRDVWEIINPKFGTGVDQGYVKDATYIAIIFAVIEGNTTGKTELLKRTFRNSLPNVNSRISSVGKVIGTAQLGLKQNISSLMNGGRRRRSTRRKLRRSKTRRHR